MSEPPREWEALKRHIAAHAVEGTPEERRVAFLALSCGQEAGETVVIGGVPCRRFGDQNAAPILWLHGGGLVFGSSVSHAAGAECLAHLTDRSVIVPDYRLAPEHSWPAALDDVMAVCDALDGAVAVVGDSAGGLLALNLALDRPGRISKLALISPNTDRRGASTTRVRNSSTDLMNDDATDAELARMAFGEDPGQVAAASPLFADLTGLPPVWITASTDEVLLDDALLLIRALGLAGVPVAAEIRKGLCHLWTLWPEALDDSRQTYRSLARFLT